MGGCRVGSGRSRLTRATGLVRSRALAAECALRCLHPLTELGSHLTVVPEIVAEPGVPANAALVVAATLEVQLVGGFQQRVQLDRRGRGGGTPFPLPWPCAWPLFCHRP